MWIQVIIASLSCYLTSPGALSPLGIFHKWRSACLIPSQGLLGLWKCGHSLHISKGVMRRSVLCPVGSSLTAICYSSSHSQYPPKQLKLEVREAGSERASQTPPSGVLVKVYMVYNRLEVGEEGKPWFVVLTDSCGVNTPATICFKLQHGFEKTCSVTHGYVVLYFHHTHTKYEIMPKAEIIVYCSQII